MTQQTSSTKGGKTAATKNSGGGDSAPAEAAAAAAAPAETEASGGAGPSRKSKMGKPAGWTAAADAYIKEIKGFFQFRRGNCFRGTILAEHPASVSIAAEGKSAKKTNMRNVFVVRVASKEEGWDPSLCMYASQVLDERGQKMMESDPDTGELRPQQTEHKCKGGEILMVQAPAKLQPYMMLVHAKAEPSLQFEIDARVKLKSGRKMWTFLDLYSDPPVSSDIEAMVKARRANSPEGDDLGDDIPEGGGGGGAD